MSTTLRTTFWLHAVVAFVFGIGFVFLPTFMADVFEVDLGDPVISRLLGAAMISLAVSSVLAAMARTLQRVDIVLYTEIVFTITATLVVLAGILFGSLAPIMWVAVALFGIFAVLFGYGYLQTRSVRQVEPGQPALR